MDAGAGASGIIALNARLCNGLPAQRLPSPRARTPKTPKLQPHTPKWLVQQPQMACRCWSQGHSCPLCCSTPRMTQ